MLFFRTNILILCCIFKCVFPRVLFPWSVPTMPQEFSDPRDADDARYNLNGRDFDGSRLLVEFARGVSSKKLVGLIKFV